jgi:hypothetical protein
MIALEIENSRCIMQLAASKRNEDETSIGILLQPKQSAKEWASINVRATQLPSYCEQTGQPSLPSAVLQAVVEFDPEIDAQPVVEFDGSSMYFTHLLLSCESV